MRPLVEQLIAATYDAYLDDRSGEILHGIPALEGIDPDSFGICLATADGHTYTVGDTGLPFCLQSISKAFTYSAALTDRGSAAVDARIDMEPSGDAFNEISLDPVTHRPRNAMINAGAIAAASLVDGAGVAGKSARIDSIYAAFAGCEVPIDEQVFASQMGSAHRNLAIAHLLREFDILACEPAEAIEIYLRQCSALVDCRELALMGATLANAGTHPISGERVISSACTERVLSVMATCGMYDGAGEWVASVGMPAKSGVSGAILAVLPGQLSLALFSPRLDQHGTSVRGMRACRRLSSQLELHALHLPRPAHSAIRDSYDLLEAPSVLQRSERDRDVLERNGRRARIYEVHGDLLFAGAESVARELESSCAGLDYLVLDVRRIDAVSDIALQMLGSLKQALAARQTEGVLIDPDGKLTAAHGGKAKTFDTLAAATAWCEDRLLERYGDGDGGDRDSAGYRLEQVPLLAAADPGLTDRLAPHLTAREYADGEVIVAEDGDRDGMFVVLAGRAAVTVTNAAGTKRRVGLAQPGAWFGGPAMVTGKPSRGGLEAVAAVRAVELTRESCEAIRTDHPELWAELLELIVHAVQDDVDRVLRGIGNARVTPMTAT